MTNHDGCYEPSTTRLVHLAQGVMKATISGICVFLSVLYVTSARAQDGPFVPCTDCDSRTRATFPVAGPWANTNLTGSGFLLEVQNGVLAGFYFGYNEEGRPEWLLFSGPLTPGESGSNVQWQLEASLSRFSGGSCPTCEYLAPDNQASVGTVKLKFFQRNHASFQIDSNAEQFMVPLLYGSAGYARFSDHSSYLLPELGSDDRSEAAWLVSLYIGDPPDRNVFSSVLVHFESSTVTTSEETGTDVEYHSVEKLSNLDEDAPIVKINCTDRSGSGDLQCEVQIALGNYLNTYYMPIANLGASRFFAESEEGFAVEGFRVGYD